MGENFMLRSLGDAAGVVAAVVVTALLLYRAAPEVRRHMRRLLVLLGLYLVALVASWSVPDSVFPKVHDVAHAATEVLGLFTLVAVGGVVLFDLALPAVRLKLPTIAYELTMAVCYAFTAVWVMRRFGVNPTGLFTTSAVVTGILALSLQATLGNVLGGVALQVDNSIRVGDWVQLENGRQGVVREIRWRHTVIETRDLDRLVVPNAQLLAATFTILGGASGEPPKRRELIPFNVDFRWSPGEVTAIVEEALRASPIEGVAESPLPVCLCVNLADPQRQAMAVYEARVWSTSIQFDEPIRHRVRLRVHAALKRAGIPLAVPAAQLWIENDSPERRARKAESDLERRRQAIRTVPFFAPLRADEVDKLAEELRYSPFVAGEELTRQGDCADWLYILTAGTAEVVVEAAQGREQVATVTGPDVVGEMGLMTGAPRTASIVARSDVESFRLDKEAFHAVLSERPELVEQISALMASREVTLHSKREGAAAARDHVENEQRLLGAVRRFFGIERDA